VIHAKFVLVASAVGFDVISIVLILSVLHHRDSFRKRLLFGFPLLVLIAGIGFAQMDVYRRLTAIRKPLDDDFLFAVLVLEFSLAIAVMFGRAMWLRRSGWWTGKGI
jgi:hypothetical protein